MITVALAGNPNSGKTTIFNALTGARQHVGNYPGVTVEKKEGIRHYRGIMFKIIDLPGTYSLTSASPEELVARKVIVEEKPDVVVDILDGSNLERNLYLTTQFMELGVPMVLAVNMSDTANAMGYVFDLKSLADDFNSPIVPTVGHRKKGMNEILDAVIEISKQNAKNTHPVSLNYGDDFEREIQALQKLIERSNKQLADRYNPRWLAIKLIEKDEEILSKISSPEVKKAMDETILRLEASLEQEADQAIAERRYAYLDDLCRKRIRCTHQASRTLSDKIDSVLTHRVFAIPIFLGLMYLMFAFTFTLSEPVMGWIEDFFGWASNTVSGWWPEGTESPLKSLIVDGIIGGVGGVLVFLPNIVFLFLAIAFLEDTGYMARAAFIMDRVMSAIGLHGKSFIPMLLGFGCSVPAIMGTRILEDRRHRLVTMLVIPLMSCGARLPIYMLIIPAFFPKAWQTPVLWLIYIIGVVLAIIVAKLLQMFLFKGEAIPFVMELPLYRLPTIRGLTTHMWERSWLYLKKAGTLILGASILLWLATTYPKPTERQLAGLDEESAKNVELLSSIAGRTGKAMEPIIKPMGFDWKIGTALIGALAAKEVFVAQMGIVYNMGQADENSESLRAKLQENYSPLVGFCIMLFCLITAPCVATFAVMKRESNSWTWAMAQFVGLGILAWGITTIVYQAGILLKIGVNG
jgi:ferrous iron transport protein B